MSKTSNFCFVIHLCWDLLPVVAHPGPPRAIIDNEAGRADARPLLFYTASALEQARLAGYKTTTPDFRQALHCRDSVGIRTQDPQLRRLLLYPAELPNQSKWTANVGVFEELCKFILNTLFTCMRLVLPGGWCRRLPIRRNAS